MGICTQLMSCIIFQKSVLIDGSLAWEFGQRRSAGRLRRSRREVAFRFTQGDKGAGAAADRALPACGSSLLTTCSLGPAESQQLCFCLYPNPKSKGVREENGKRTLFKTQSCLEDTFVASMC